MPVPEAFSGLYSTPTLNGNTQFDQEVLFVCVMFSQRVGTVPHLVAALGTNIAETISTAYLPMEATHD